MKKVSLFALLVSSTCAFGQISQQSGPLNITLNSYDPSNASLAVGAAADADLGKCVGLNLTAVGNVYVLGPLTCSGGGGGTPGGSTNNIQYNAGGGNFGGVSGANRLGSAIVFNTQTLRMLGASTGTAWIDYQDATATDRIYTIPTISTLTDTFVTLGSTQTFTGINTFSAQQIISGTGSVTSPVLDFSGCGVPGVGTACGFYSPGANKLDFVALGAKIWDFNDSNTNQLTIDVTATAAGVFNAANSIVFTVNTNQLRWFSGGIMTGPGAGVIQLGAADAAAPVAQLLKAQSVVAGTTTTAGVSFSIQGSRSTGTANSGDIIFQTGQNIAAATTQNALVTALTLKGNTQLVYTNSATQILGSNTTITGGGTGNVPTLTAGPVTGNPTKWLPYDDNGVTRYIPAW